MNHLLAPLPLGNSPHASSDKPLIRTGDSPSVLEEILEPGVQLARWQRTPIAGIAPVLERLLTSQPPPSLVGISPTQAALQMALGGGEMPGADLLAADIQDLLSRFTRITRRRHARLRLERLEHGGCAKFHMDHLRLRLICTYHGAGTEWVEESNLRRQHLGRSAESVEAANARIVIDPAKIRRAHPWDVLLVKGVGKGHPHALVHRSGPAEAPATMRILLRMDEPDACQC